MKLSGNKKCLPSSKSLKAGMKVKHIKKMRLKKIVNLNFIFVCCFKSDNINLLKKQKAGW